MLDNYVIDGKILNVIGEDVLWKRKFVLEKIVERFWSS